MGGQVLSQGGRNTYGWDEPKTHGGAYTDCVTYLWLKLCELAGQL
jgi:hypothetical protein